MMQLLNKRDAVMGTLKMTRSVIRAVRKRRILQQRDAVYDVYRYVSFEKVPSFYTNLLNYNVSFHNGVLMRS